ncbi:MAG: hypothetical protein PHS53_04725 [Candidatus Pacebacteria bacterium]|nr:hypothetical protein [Candidatus Paceibacterota bacterium]MDD5357422.1 hypothetical protein [Candidatus Paceibacterota bacterium]
MEMPVEVGTDPERQLAFWEHQALRLERELREAEIENARLRKKRSGDGKTAELANLNRRCTELSGQLDTAKQQLSDAQAELAAERASRKNDPEVPKAEKIAPPVVKPVVKKSSRRDETETQRNHKDAIVLASIFLLIGAAGAYTFVRAFAAPASSGMSAEDGTKLQKMISNAKTDANVTVQKLRGERDQALSDLEKAKELARRLTEASKNPGLVWGVDQVLLEEGMDGQTKAILHMRNCTFAPHADRPFVATDSQRLRGDIFSVIRAKVVVIPQPPSSDALPFTFTVKGKRGERMSLAAALNIASEKEFLDLLGRKARRINIVFELQRSVASPTWSYVEVYFESGVFHDVEPKG